MPQKEKDSSDHTRTAEPIKVDYIDEEFIECLIKVGSSKKVIDAAKNFKRPDNR